MTIRMATFDDLPEIIRVGKQLHKRTPYQDIEIDTQSMIKGFSMGVQAATACLIIETQDGEIRGFLLGCLQDLWWSRSRIATDLAFTFGTGWGGIAMIRMFHEWAFEQPRVVEVTMGISTGIAPDRAAALYQRAGMDFMGGMFTKFRA